MNFLVKKNAPWVTGGHGSAGSPNPSAVSAAAALGSHEPRHERGYFSAAATLRAAAVMDKSFTSTVMSAYFS